MKIIAIFLLEELRNLALKQFITYRKNAEGVRSIIHCYKHRSMQSEEPPPEHTDPKSVLPSDEPDHTVLPCWQFVPPRGKTTYSTSLLKIVITELSLAIHILKLE